MTCSSDVEPLQPAITGLCPYLFCNSFSPFILTFEYTYALIFNYPQESNHCFWKFTLYGLPNLGYVNCYMWRPGKYICTRQGKYALYEEQHYEEELWDSCLCWSGLRVMRTANWPFAFEAKKQQKDQDRLDPLQDDCCNASGKLDMQKINWLTTKHGSEKTWICGVDHISHWKHTLLPKLKTSCS